MSGRPLAELEQEVDQCLLSISRSRDHIRIGEILSEIKERNLYKPNTWEAYVRGRWDFSYRQANNYIRSAREGISLEQAAHPLGRQPDTVSGFRPPDPMTTNVVHGSRPFNVPREEPTVGDLDIDIFEEATDIIRNDLEIALLRMLQADSAAWLVRDNSVSLDHRERLIADLNRAKDHIDYYLARLSEKKLEIVK